MSAKPARFSGPLRTAAILVAAGLLAAGCSGGSGVSTASVPSANVVPSPQAGSGEARSDAVSGTSGAPADAPAKVAPGSTTFDATALGRSLARTASLTLTVADVPKAAQQIRVIVAGVKGIVVQEMLSDGEGNPPVVPLDSKYPYPGGSSMVVVQVPSASLDPVLDRLAALGTVRVRTTTTEDVTTQLVDTQSRLATMKASVERVRALMAQATNIAQVVTLEGELSRREADLEALQSTLASLKGQVEMSTVTVSLDSPAKTTTEEPDNGFLSGLKAGWKALVTGLGVGLTVIGAVTPFLLLVALIGIPVLRWWRRRGATATPTTPATGAPEQTMPAPEGAAAAPTTEESA
jgi:hypothetical protein